MRRLAAALACLFAICAPARAIVGTAEPAGAAIARHVVMVVGGRGSACSGTAVARDLVLTAAHCLQPGGQYSVTVPDNARRPQTIRVARFSAGFPTERAPPAGRPTALVSSRAAAAADLAPLGARDSS
jgi:hypothetical protein